LRALVIAVGLGATTIVPALQLVAPAWGVPLPAAAVVGDSSGRVLMLVWLAGTAANLLVLLVGMFRLMGLAAAADPIRDGVGADLALDITAEHRVHAPVL